MKLIILSTTGAVTINQFEPKGLQDLIDAIDGGTSYLQFNLNGDRDITYINPAHVVRVDVEFEE